MSTERLQSASLRLAKVVEKLEAGLSARQQAGQDAVSKDGKRQKDAGPKDGSDQKDSGRQKIERLQKTQAQARERLDDVIRRLQGMVE